MLLTSSNQASTSSVLFQKTDKIGGFLIIGIDFYILAQENKLTIKLGRS